PGAGALTSTPISRSSRAIVRTSMSCGTLASRSGSAVRSAAHMMGKAAFWAPLTCTSPSSGTPPRMRSLSTGAPLFRGERAHGKGVDLLAHALAQRRIDELVALHAISAGELRRHDEGLKMLAVAGDFDALAGERALDALLDAFWRDHQYLSLYPDLSSHRLTEDTTKTKAATIARLAAGAKSETPKNP